MTLTTLAQIIEGLTTVVTFVINDLILGIVVKGFILNPDYLPIVVLAIGGAIAYKIFAGSKHMLRM